MYQRYHHISDITFYIFAALFAGIALIRDCVVELWTAVLLNPVMMNFIFVMNWIILPVLAVITLFFEYADNRRLQVLAVLGLLLMMIYQLYTDYQIYQDPVLFLNHITMGSSFERGLWIYYNTSGCRWGVACLIVAAKSRDFRKIAWIYVVSQIVLMLIITGLALTGLIPDMVFAEVGRPERHALGLHYPLNYAAHWFSISLIYCYLKNGFLKIWDYLGLFVLLAVSMFVCKAQTTSVLFFILIAGTVLRQVLRNRILGTRKHMMRCLKYSFLFFAAFMIAASLLYVPPISTELDKITVLRTLFSRFTLGRIGLLEYFPSLLGVEYPISTWSGTIMNEDYFFVDCSYIYELLHCGILVYPLIMVLLWYMPHRFYKKGQGYALCILALLACICAMEHHLSDLSFNIFWLMIFAGLEGSSQSNAVASLSSLSKSTS